MRLKDNDKIIGAGLCSDTSQIIAATSSGNATMLPAQEFELKGRGGLGVKLCPLNDAEEITLTYIHESDNLLAIMVSDEKKDKADPNPVKFSLPEAKKTQKPQKTERQILEIGTNRWE